MHPKHEKITLYDENGRPLEIGRLTLATKELSEAFRQLRTSAAEYVAELKFWAIPHEYNCRVAHLAKHGRTERVRKKNKARMEREATRWAKKQTR